MNLQELIRSLESKGRDLPVYVRTDDGREPVPLTGARTETMFVFRGVDDNDEKRYGKITALVLDCGKTNV